MKHRKKLRRVAILALVLVLLFNTIGVQADTGTPKVTVSSYGELYSAYTEATDGDVIGIRGTIVIPTLVSLNTKYVTFKRMEAGAKIYFSDSYNRDAVSEVKGITFDGNSTEVGGTNPFVVAGGKINFNYCDFLDCLYQGDNGGALYIAYGEINLKGCGFEGNSALNGSHIYNNGTLTLDSCHFKDGWADEKGGALYNAGTAYIDYTEIKENNARIGGGIYNNASMEISNSLVWSNTATIQGADIANEGSLTNNTTEDQYNSWLEYYNLYYAGWEDDTNTSIGGAGDYMKLLTTTEDPNTPTTPEPSTEESTETPPEPTEPSTESGTEESTEESTETPPEPSTEENTEEPSTEESTENTEDPKPSTPSEADKGGSVDNSNNSINNTDNSITDNSQTSNNTDNSTTDNSVTDNSSTDNSQSSSNVSIDNSSSSTSNVTNTTTTNTTDNSSSRSESAKTENSNNSTSNTTNNTTTTNNSYYTQEQAKSSSQPTGASSQPISVNVTVPQANSTPVTENSYKVEKSQDQSVNQNIHIDAEGVNVSYEYTEDGVNISITPYKATESPKEENVSIGDTVTHTASTTATGEQNKPNWVESITMILLALLVLLEIKDRLKKKPE